MRTTESIYKSRGKIFTDNLVGGLAWAIGVTLGFAIIFAVFTFLSKQVNLVPVVGSFVADVMSEVAKRNPQLLK